MGSIVRSKPDSVREWLKTEFSGEFNGIVHEVVDLTIVKKRTAYLAVRRTHKESGKQKTMAVVVKLRFWEQTLPHPQMEYKSMDEFMGPHDRECPARILDLLTPLGQSTTPDFWWNQKRTDILDLLTPLGQSTGGYAGKWRSDCRERISQLKAAGQMKLAAKFATTSHKDEVND